MSIIINISDLQQFNSSTFNPGTAMNSICFLINYKMKYVAVKGIRRSTRHVDLDEAINAIKLSIESLGTKRMEVASKLFRTTILTNLYKLKEQYVKSNIKN